MLDRQLARCRGDWGEALALAREGRELASSSDMAAEIVMDAALDAHRPREAVAVFDSIRPDAKRVRGTYPITDSFLWSLHLLGKSAITARSVCVSAILR